MNTSSILAAECGIALAFASWASIKDKQLPWPPTIVKSCVAFGILGVTATLSPELAATLGAGFLLAQMMRALEKKPPYTGGAPVNLGDGTGELTGKTGAGQIHTGILAFNTSK
jgi:hypothetical protein